MASKPKLELVPQMASFDEALARILNLRTSVALIASPDISSLDMALTFYKEEPAFEIVLHIKPGVDYNRTLYALKANPLSDYRFEKVEAKRDGMSATRYLVIAIVTKSYSA